MTSRRTHSVLAGVWAIAPFPLLLLAASLWRQPDRVPTHWTGDLPDGFSSGSGLFVACLSVAGFCAVTSALVVLLSFLMPARWSRAVITALAAVGAGATAMYGAAAWGTHLAGGPERVPLVWALVPFVVALLWGAGAWLLNRPAPIDRQAVLETVPERSRVVPQPSSDEIRWITQVRSGVLAGTAVFVFLVLGVSAVLAWQAGAVMALLLGLLALVAGAFTASWGRVEVRVDEDGLTIRSVVLPVTLKRISASEVVGVTTADLDPMKWGGIGLRWLPDRTAYIARGGPGIVVHRESGRRFGVEITEGEEVAAAGARALLQAAGRAIVTTDPA